MSPSPDMTGDNCSRHDQRCDRIAAPTGLLHMTETLARDHIVTNIEVLERLYGQPFGPSIAKESDRVTAHYHAFIEAAPFFALASGSPDGLDCSPRGDAPGF